MSHLVLHVAMFVGSWFVCSLLLGLFIGVCIGQKRADPIPASRHVAPSWASPLLFERRRMRRSRTAHGCRDRHAHYVA